MEIKTFVKEAHQVAVEHGFWDESREVGTLLMLVVSELGEAIEAHRHGDREGFEEEIADTFIRLADLCGGLGINIERAIIQKMAVNAMRPRLHGKAY